MIAEFTGLYKVGNELFISKLEAMLRATSSNEKVSYYYHDDVWDSNIKTYTYNNHNLLALYKTRAQQIRDKYDYLVLHFSGGSDSTTVLQSFIHNNIKLDEVYVKWPIKLLSSSIYTPNILDTSATNMLSEWDFSIKPKLDWLKANNPDIKIVIEDWTDDLYASNTATFNEKLFLVHNHNFGLVNFIFSEKLSKSSISVQNQGKRVAHIYGAEKPLITYVKEINSFYMYFTDASTTAVGYQHAFGKASIENKVDFYNAPEYPELTLARAYAMATFLTNNPSLLYLVDSSNGELSSSERTSRADKFQKLCAKILYPNWDTSTFQVDKTDVSNRLYHPWYHYVFNSDEFADKQKKIQYTLKDFSAGISSNLLSIDKLNNVVGLRPVLTKFFKMKEIT